MTKRDIARLGVIRYDVVRISVTQYDTARLDVTRYDVEIVGMTLKYCLLNLLIMNMNNSTNC